MSKRVGVNCFSDGESSFETAAVATCFVFLNLTLGSSHLPTPKIYHR